MRKLLTWCVTVAMVSLVFSFPYNEGEAATVQFQDLTKSSSGYGYAYDFVSYLTAHDVIHGYTINGKNYFKPDASLTREQAAIMLVKALGEGPSTTKKPYFTDVDASHSAFGYIQKSKELGIFNGYSDGRFGASDQLSRQQMAYVITSAFKLAVPSHYPSGFKDLSSSKAGYDKMNALYFDGISQGSNGRYLPTSPISRAAFSVFVARGMAPSLRLQPQQSTGVVNVDMSSYLNVRSAPKVSGLQIGGLKQGQQVAIYDESSDWYKILYDGKWGFVSKSFVDKVSAVPTTTSNSCSESSSDGTSHVASATPCTPNTIPTSTNSDSSSTVNGNGSTSGTSSTGTTTDNGQAPANGTSPTDTTGTSGASGSDDPNATGSSSSTTDPLTNGSATDGSGTGTGSATGTATGTGSTTGTTTGTTGTGSTTGTATGTGSVTDTTTGAGSTTDLTNGTPGTTGTGTSTTDTGTTNGTGTSASGTTTGTTTGTDGTSGTSTGTTNGTSGSSTSTPLDMSKPLANKVIVIDPGHGGDDPGTSSNGVDEKVVTLEVGKDVQTILESLGATVYMTRTSDTTVSLADRVALSDKVNADIYLSIHCNSASSIVSGTETYYDNYRNPFPWSSQMLAQDVQQGIVSATQSYDRGYRLDTSLYSVGLYVLRENQHAAILTELGFLSNPNERLMLSNSRSQMGYATGIVNGILKYFITLSNG